MRTSRWWLSILLLALVPLLGSCHRQEAGATKKFYWVQPYRGHPVHQFTQIAFRDGCRSLGYDCQVIGADTWDVAGTVSLAEQALAKGDAAGMAIWRGDPGFDPFIEELGKAGIPVIVPHFPLPADSVPGLTGTIGCDPAEYAVAAAAEISKQLNGKGTVAVTQGSSNPTENLVSETFVKTMQARFPEVKLLPVEMETLDPTKAAAVAASILQAHDDLAAALSTTGGGPTAWATAARNANRKLLIIGMDYTRQNLDLVADGEVYAVVGQPLWEESHGAAELLDKAVHGQKLPWWTKLEAPLITKDKLAPYYELQKRAEAAAEK